MATNVPSPEFPDGVAVERKPITMRGRTRPVLVEVPQRYYDASVMMAHFPACARRIQELVRATLQSDTVTPVRLAPGIGVVSLAAIDYRRPSSLARYKEVAIMMPILPRGDFHFPAWPFLAPASYPDLGFHIQHLPVTTDDACEAGLQLWNFPKFKAKITFRDLGWTRRCDLHAEDDTRILSLSVRISLTRTGTKNLLAYSRKDGRLLRTLIESQAQYDETHFSGGAWVSLGDHPIAEELRKLSMLNVAVGRLYAPFAKSRLNAGQPFDTRPASGSGS